MSQYDDTNTGALFINDKGDNDKRPDRKGKLNVEGVEYQISGWLRTPKSGGAQFLSLKVERSDKQQAQGRDRTPQDAYRKTATTPPMPPKDGYKPDPDDDTSDIPW